MATVAIDLKTLSYG